MSDFDDAFAKGRQAKIEKIAVNGIEHIQVPNDCNLESMENLMDAPARIKASPEFNDLNGFSDYIKEFVQEGSRIFVNERARIFTTIFDCHSKDKPAWGDHSANLKLYTSNEWERFKQIDGDKLSPIEFAEFLEDNLAYLDPAGNLTAGDLLSMAQTYKIKVKGEIDVQETLQAGHRRLIIIDDSKLSGTDKKGKEIKFPEKIQFKLRIFKNCGAYPIEVFLRHRAKQDSLTFFIKIPDPIGLQEEAFNHELENVKQKTKLPTLKGSFDGPSHRRK